MQKQRHVSWETFALADIERTLSTDFKNGLSQKKVDVLQNRHGKNIFETEEEIDVEGGGV